MSKQSEFSGLAQLARLYGIQTAYYDVWHRRRSTSRETIVALLRSLGAPLNSAAEVSEALRHRRQMLWQRMVEPVIVSWEGNGLTADLRWPASQTNGPVTIDLQLEDKTERNQTIDSRDLPNTDTAEIEGIRYLIKRLSLPEKLPLGYHHVRLEINGHPFESRIIAAPMRAYSPDEQGADRHRWGAFLPLYALHSRHSWGSGDFSDMEALSRWIGEKGGGLVATLPLLPTFLDEPFQPSPYSPVSRLLWNEFYIDVTRSPELAQCSQAQALIASADFQAELTRLRQSPRVDYRRQMGAKRHVLELLSQSLTGDNQQRLAEFAQTHPAADDYARFRATHETRRQPWSSWPQSLRHGDIAPDHFDETIHRYYLYAQWLTHQQMAQLENNVTQDASSQHPLGLYLDYPLGIHPQGYDAWRFQDCFMSEASTGAPPDAVFTGGQDWGTPPFHPERLRQSGYAHYTNCLRHHLRHADVLRIDHIMGLHRLWVAPPGMESSQGTYLHYPAEEFYAILTLESHRHQTAIVGEDLGTVPPYVRPAMRRHGIYGMYVLQYQLDSHPGRGVGRIGKDQTASINTHDMPPFRQYWQGTDITIRRQTGLLSASQAQQEMTHRTTLKQSLATFLKRHGFAPKDVSSEMDAQEALRGSLAYLEASPALATLVNLEDLWLEETPQNMPGTDGDAANWSRKTQHSLEVFQEMPQVVESLRQLNRSRQAAPGADQRHPARGK